MVKCKCTVKKKLGKIMNYVRAFFMIAVIMGVLVSIMNIISTITNGYVLNLSIYLIFILPPLLVLVGIDLFAFEKQGLKIELVGDTLFFNYLKSINSNDIVNQYVMTLDSIKKVDVKGSKVIIHGRVKDKFNNDLKMNKIVIVTDTNNHKDILELLGEEGKKCTQN